MKALRQNVVDEIIATSNLRMTHGQWQEVEKLLLKVSDMYEEVLAHLGSMEGFVVAGVVDPDNKWCRELQARIEYAREALGPEWALKVQNKGERL